MKLLNSKKCFHGRDYLCITAYIHSTQTTAFIEEITDMSPRTFIQLKRLLLETTYTLPHETKCIEGTAYADNCFSSSYAVFSIKMVS